jgi:hypothetical protein
MQFLILEFLQETDLDISFRDVNSECKYVIPWTDNVKQFLNIIKQCGGHDRTD